MNPTANSFIIYNYLDLERKIYSWPLDNVGARGTTLPQSKTLMTDFPGGTVEGILTANTGDTGLIPSQGRFHML